MFWKYQFDTFIDLLSSQSWLNYFSAVFKQQMELYWNPNSAF